MVKTYAVNCNDAWLNTDGDDISGSYVKYEDYAELERRLIAAEAQEPIGEVVLGHQDDEGCYPGVYVTCLAGDACADWDNFPDGFKLYAAPVSELSDVEMRELQAIGIRKAAHSGQFSTFVNTRLISFAMTIRNGDENDYLRTLPDVDVQDGEINDGLVLHGLKIDGHSQLSDSFRLGFRYARRTATVAQPVQDPSGWIECSNRLPDNKPGRNEYLVYETMNNRVQHDYWNTPDEPEKYGDFTPFWNHYGNTVTHWMPLPAAPQPESD